MARINQYTQDENVTFGDKLLGSDSGGATRNFSLESISNFFKETSDEEEKQEYPTKLIRGIILLFWFFTS